MGNKNLQKEKEQIEQSTKKWREKKDGIKKETNFDFIHCEM